MDLDLRAIAENIRRADTEDLLDRVTIYRDEMEPAAVDLIEGELARRRVTPREIADHDEKRRTASLVWEDGVVCRCEKCDRPAVVRKRIWHRLWGRLPIFPRWGVYCEEHEPT